MLHALLLLLSAAAPAESGYVWPLALEPQLTSSFAEYRPGRFHAGIDLRTNGVGREVFAAGDGYVSRVRCSPYGYGKAVYLQLADGHVAIYAHLSGYYPALAEFVRAEQHRQKNYTVDVQLRPSQFPIQRGQLIALSGQTGIGAPHLHYELRNAAEEPVNPRLMGIDWPDNTRPAIRKILVAAKGLEGRVNGDVLPAVLDVLQDEQGQFRTPPVRASGMIGLGADVLDPGAGGYNLGVHSLRLLAGGAEIFRMQHDRMSYTNHRNAAVSYHPQMHDQGRFLLLWRWPGNRCDSYQQSPDEGWVSVPAAGTEYVVEAADFQGNRVQVVVPVLPDDGVAAPAAAGSGLDLEMLGTDLMITVRFAQAVSEAPRLSINGAAGPSFTSIHDTLSRALITPRKSGIYSLSVAHAALSPFSSEVAVWVQGAPAATLPLGDLRVTAGPDTPYGTLMLRGWAVDNPPAASMPARSAAYQLWPGDAPVFNPIRVSLPLAAGASYQRNIHVYRHRGTYWSREDTTFEDGRLEIEVESPGLFQAMEDAERPNFANVSPAEGLAVESRRPEIRASVLDTGSGIAGFGIHCGEQWLLTAYDPEHDEIRWEQDEDLPSGPQTLTFTITDEAGNTQTYGRNITVP